MSGERLSKFLARCGVASRRKSEDIVKSGRVYVNGTIVTDPYYRVVFGADLVSLDGKEVSPSFKPYYVALYKPVDYISDLADPKGRRLARELIDVEAPLFPVGRLDYKSEGLMIFTNDGDFADAMMHPRHEVEKEYAVKLSGRLTKEELCRMRSGVPVEGQVYKVKTITFMRETQRNAWYAVTVTEGRNRMIRKMAQAISHPVLKLKRVRIDGITLGGLQPGEFRHIRPSVLCGFGMGVARKTRGR